ncbi:MAG: MMPL family transporter, partial [Pseudomonadota bacterium]
VVHIQHRYIQEGPGSISRVVATTGSAAFLASATTAFGFGAAITARHFGIQSLGVLSIVGLGCTFVASTVFFPALLRLLEKKSENEQ